MREGKETIKNQTTEKKEKLNYSSQLLFPFSISWLSSWSWETIPNLFENNDDVVVVVVVDLICWFGWSVLTLNIVSSCLINSTVWTLGIISLKKSSVSSLDDVSTFFALFFANTPGEISYSLPNGAFGSHFGLEILFNLRDFTGREVVFDVTVSVIGGNDVGGGENVSG